jgi:selenocysteine lyase/cysteine desulfurase
MLINQRSKFSIPKGFTYLNCAYMSPLMKSVERAGIMGMQKKRNPFKIPATEFFREAQLLRQEFAKLINLKQPNRIAIVASASYGIANVTQNLRLNSNDNVIVAAEQFPSNYYPWQRACSESGAVLNAISPPDSLSKRAEGWNQRILEAINKKTRVVALGNVHWADGTLFDLLAIRKRTRDVGALLIIDGTQSVGALPFDVEKIQPDSLVCGGYKWLMGPYAIGLAYYGDYFNEGKPVEENWINRLNSEDFASLVSYQENYQPGALRYEVGEHSNFILVPMMIQALKQLNQWKPKNIQEYCGKITAQPLKKLVEFGFWVEDEKFRGRHLFGIRIPKGYDVTKAKETLIKKKISVSFRGDAIRIAPNVYNSEAEMMRLVNLLTS